MTKSIWKEVFQAGSQTDSSGKTREWTINDLDTIASKYNSQTQHEAPIVVGHPVTDAPAYGWVESLKREGSKLLAKIKDIDSAFAEMVNTGRFKKTSISLYPDLLLKHIGFLGAMPPAVKGLKDVKFNENEETIILNYEEFSVNDDVLKQLVEYVSKTFNPEMANQILAEGQKLMANFAAKAPAKKDPLANLAPPFGKPDPSKDPKLDPKKGKKFNEDEEEGENNLESKFSEENAKLRQEVESMKFEMYFAEKVREGKAIPSEKATIKTLYSKLATTEEFSEFDKLIDNRKSFDFNETATKEKAVAEGQFSEAIDKTVDEFNKRRGY